MPAGDIRVSLTFKESLTGKDLGWSEEHYHVTAADLAVAKTDALVLATRRAYLLGIGVLLQSINVSDVTVWRDSDFAFPATPRDVDGLPVYNPSFRSKETWKADFAYSSLLTRLESLGSPLYRRSHWISGNPDEAQGILVRDPTGVAAWNTAWTAYRNLLAPPGGVGGKWGFRVKSRDPTTTFETPIDHITDDSGILAFNSLPAGFAEGRLVVVRNVRGLTPRIAGTYQIVTRAVVGGATLITLQNVGTAGGGSALTGAYTGTGYMRLLVPLTVAYATAQIKRFGVKKFGGPSDRARGRQRQRKPAV